MYHSLKALGSFFSAWLLHPRCVKHPALLCPSDSLSAQVMNAGICVCVLLAALYSSGCHALPTHSLDESRLDGAVDEHTRHTRAVPPSGQLSLLSKAQEEEVQEDPARRLNELLARLISRKGTVDLSCE
ncbi:hypothetical protein NFI96_003487 [Prochilodus magdalenae]|nr:hypothetical protein NFI96_003487 [Prochilodus magdalenae]